MDERVEPLWIRLHPLLDVFARQVAESHPGLRARVDGSANDVFLLRAHAAFIKSNNGDEIAISVDVIPKGAAIGITSDLCMDKGEILAVGPGAEIPLSEISSLAATSDWLRRFRQFLSDVEPQVRARASMLG